MNQTLVRRLGMARGAWHLLRYQSQLCRWSSIPVDERNPVGADQVPRWLGNIRIGGRSHHALFCPPAGRVAYRFWAPTGARIVAWCGLLPDTPTRDKGAAEFVVTVRTVGSSSETIGRLRLDPNGSARHRGWRKLVLELRNRDPQQIELTFTTRVAGEAGNEPWTIWGEPRLEWRRPVAEVKRLLRDVKGTLLRGKLIAAGRTVHGRLSSSSHPSLYQMWLSQHDPTQERLDAMRTQSEALSYRPLVSIVTPVYNTDARWLRACVESVKRQAYPHWQLCLADDGSTRQETLEALRELAGDPRIRIHTLPANAGISAASNAALALAEGEFVAFLDHDDEITQDALFEVVSFLNDHPDADFLYSDEDKLEMDGTRTGVYFKPDWSHEHFLTNMYTCHLMVVRRALLERIGGFRAGYEGAQDYDLVLRLIEQTTRIHHLAKVLYHWRRIPESTAGSETAKPGAHDAGRLALQDYVRRNKLDAEIVPGEFTYLYRVRFAIRGQPLVSVVVPALPCLDSSESLDACQQTLRTLADRTSYRRFEVVVVTTEEVADDRVARMLSTLPCREVRVAAAQLPGRVGQLRMAAAHAAGEHLLFLDWGMHALDSDWLTALLEYSQQPGIGAVGGKLVYPDGSLKHIGLVLGVNGVAARAFHRHSPSSLGYWGTAIAARNYSAVSGACLMTRRRLFEEAGGFQDEMGSLADIDYCLRVIAAGHRVVFTPHAKLVHAASEDSVDEAAVNGQASRLREVWGDRVTNDPYYNANFSRHTPDYEPDLSVASSAR